MYGIKGPQLTQVGVSIFIISVMMVFPFVNCMTMDSSLDSFKNEQNEFSTQKDTHLSDNELSPPPAGISSNSLYFTKNMGQWGDHVIFLAETSFGYAALGDDGVYYYIISGEEGHTIKISFENAKIAYPVGLDDCGFESNYFYGNDATKWVTKVRSYTSVLYEEVWPGIDIRYYFKNKDLKYDILVGEFAFISDISFKVEGAGDLKVKDHELEISAGDILLKDTELIAYYSDGTSAPAAFQKKDGHSFGFLVNKAYGIGVRIDPIVFSSSSFLGGSGWDQARDLEFDPSGNIIILADTMSLDFPNTTGAFQTSITGSMDIAITKMDHNASFLIFSTYIGGYSFDFPHAMYVDANGDVYATGETYAKDFPTTNGTFMEEAPIGSTNVFVLKLSNSGSNLIYSTYVGCSYPSWANDIEVFNGDAYVVGYTYSYDFPYVDYPINNAHGTTFFFILNQDGSNLTHTAFWGGHQGEIAYELEIYKNGDVVVGGATFSPDFPTTPGAYQENATDWNNGFLLKYRPSTSTLLFSTIIGGSALDEIRSLHIGANWNIYFSGITNNPDISGNIPFPTTPGAYDRTYNGSKDAFIGQMSNNGTTLIFSTLFGSQGQETVGSIDTDSQGNVYFIGSLNSDVNFTVTPDAFDWTFNQEDDVVFAILNADCSDVLYSTYLGGNVSDIGETCLLFGTDEIHLLGTTYSKDFPSTSGSYQSQNNATGDVFIAKFSIGDYIFLHEGWNLISVPLFPLNINIDAVLSSISGCYDSVQLHDQSDVMDPWKNNHISKPPHLNDLWYLDHLKGFFIHITTQGGTVLSYNGFPPILPWNIQLYPGWNLVSYPCTQIRNRTTGLNNLVYGLDVDAIQWYDASSKTWYFMDRADSFVPGRGYWIHSNVEKEWIVQP